MIALHLGHASECPPGPAGQLALAKLLGGAYRISKVVLRLVIAAELPL